MWDSLCRLFSPADTDTEDTSSMGNTSKKLAAKCTLLTKDEQKSMAATFKAASRSSDKIREDDLIRLWGPQIDPRLAQYLSNYLFGSGANKQPTCDFNKFAELYVFNVRGTTDEKISVLFKSLGMQYHDGAELPYQLLREYSESIVSTYIRMVKSSRHPHSIKWIEKGFRGKAAHVQALGEVVAASALKDIDNPATECGADQLYRWLQSNVLLQGMVELVFEGLYSGGEERERSRSNLHQASERAPHPAHSLLPKPEGIDPLPDYPAFIDLSHIVWLNSNLPRKHQHQWRFLFSSHIHGESFSTMAGRIQDVGASIVIVEDTSGYIFGGFASESWVLKPTWYGNDESFLFTLAPKMRIYNATSFNDHYQYMNYQTKTLPNGLMMGGQFDFGGIWINADPFGTGSSAESCSTYRGFKRLSKEQSFKIRSLEVWGIGDKPLSVKDSEERDTSILDKNPEAKAILDMAGRTRHSEGIREPPAL